MINFLFLFLSVLLATLPLKIHPSIPLNIDCSQSQQTLGGRWGSLWTGRQSITGWNIETNSHSSHSHTKRQFRALTCMFRTDGTKARAPWGTERWHWENSEPTPHFCCQVTVLTTAPPFFSFLSVLLSIHLMQNTYTMGEKKTRKTHKDFLSLYYAFLYVLPCCSGEVHEWSCL